MYHKNMKQKRMCCFLAFLLLFTLIPGCSDKKTDSPPQKETTPPAKTAPVSEEDENSNLGQWGRAMGSVLIAINEGNVYYFGGYEPNEGNKKAAAQILEKSWGIKNRKDLFSQIRQLQLTGSRKEYRKEAEEMNQMSKKEVKTALKQLSGDMLTHYEMVQYNWEKWRKKGLLAWDLCRISHLVQWGYVAGYLTISEAQALIRPAAEKLKHNFSNWDEVQRNWLDGYALFAPINANSPIGTDYEARYKVYQELKAAQEQKGILYDDSLFQAEVGSIQGVDAEMLFHDVLGTK